MSLLLRLPSTPQKSVCFFFNAVFDYFAVWNFYFGKAYFGQCAQNIIECSSSIAIDFNWSAIKFPATIFSPFQSGGFCVHLLSIYEIVSMSVLGTSQQIIRSNSFWSIWFGDRLLNGISTSTERTIRRETARAKLNDKKHKTIHTFWMTWINSVPYH